MYSLIKKWLPRKSPFNAFCVALIDDNIEEMKKFINNYLQSSFESFDSINNANPECFYHGFIDEGSYYVQFKSLNRKIYPNSYILEFMVKNEDDTSLLETAKSALMLITLNGYNKRLKNEGFRPNNIKEYGFGFDGKQCEILLQTSKKPLFPGLAIPDFEFIADYAFHEKEDVFIIDKNGFDIWDGIISIINDTKYFIHYPDYPNDDEIVEKKRILPCTPKNNSIFKHQEIQRRKKEEEEIEHKTESNKKKKKGKKKF